MGRPTKATKKFVRSKLRNELALRKKRKDSAKHSGAKRKASTERPTAERQGADDQDQGGSDHDAADALGFGSDDEMDADVHSDDEHALDPFSKGSDSDEEDDDEDVSDSDADDDDIEHMDEEEIEEDQAHAQESDDDESADEFSSHKAQLEELKQRDPEFYKYLQENDQELLAFGDSESDGEQDDQNEEEEEDCRCVVTMEMVREWRSVVTKLQSVRTVRKILLAYRAASSGGDTEAAEQCSLKIDDERVFNNVVLLALRHAPFAFNKALYGSNSDPGARRGLPSAAASKKWRRIQPLVKSFLSSTLKLMAQMTDRGMLATLLKHSENAVTYFACFPKLCKDFVARLVGLWTAAEEEQIRILAFLCLRRLAIAAPNPHLPSIVKKAYSAYLEKARETNVHTWTQIGFMANCIVELSGIHLPTTYQLMFVYIRQMAIQVRNGVTNKNKEMQQGVYTWAFVHAVRMWAMVLGQYCEGDIAMDESANKKDTNVLAPLVYPLVQIVIGAMRLKPSSRFFPYRLQLVRVLVDVMKQTGVFIPVAAYILEMFHSAEMTGRTKPTTQKPLDMALTIRAPNGYLGTRVYRKSILEESVQVLVSYFATVSMRISFPELAIPTIAELRVLIKNSRDVELKRQLQSVIEKLEQSRKFIETKRSGAEFGPRDVDRVREFENAISMQETPIGKYAAARTKLAERQKATMTANEELVVPNMSDDEEEESHSEKRRQTVAQDDDEDGLDGDEDVVEDFSMWDDEGDEE